MPTEFARLLLGWYREHARGLPWRGVTDPYAVWVSEIMLQQTRVETVLDYYARWMARFPTVQALAEAEEQEVLRLWEGLGYYSRARSLHRAAREVMARFDGHLPSTRAELETLPGIGRYTAGAIASMAFGKDEPALDGNLRRVLARVFDIDIPIDSPQGMQKLEELFRRNLPPGQAGDFNQAMMDLGSAICLPRSPACVSCPVEELCRAKMLGLQEQRPVMKERQPIPHYTVTAAVLQQDSRVLIAKRLPNGLLASLWEFPGGKQEPGETLPACLKREIREELGVEIEVGAELGVFKHAYTHFKATLHAFTCRLIDGEPRPLAATELRWVLPAELDQFPMGKLDRRIALVLSTTDKI